MFSITKIPVSFPIFPPTASLIFQRLRAHLLSADFSISYTHTAYWKKNPNRNILLYHKQKKKIFIMCIANSEIFTVLEDPAS